MQSIFTDLPHQHHCHIPYVNQTAVNVDLKSKQLLLFFLTQQYVTLSSKKGSDLFEKYHTKKTFTGP